MKKIFGFVMLATLGVTSVESCGPSRVASSVLGGTGVGASVGRTVVTVVGVILLAKIVKSVLGTVTGSMAFSGLSQNQNLIQNFNENTRLDGFASNPLLKGALQVLVAERYQIPLNTVSSSYNNFTTVGDLATFIGQNAPAQVLNEFK